MFTPQELDDKSLALHHLVVRKIQRDPVLFERVKETLERWKAKLNWSTLPHVMEWQKLVDEGMDAALAVAVEKSDRGQVLRQTSPFTRILTETERISFIHSWSNSHASTGS